MMWVHVFGESTLAALPNSDTIRFDPAHTLRDIGVFSDLQRLKATLRGVASA
jgi:hypothetical protein